jgi:hypothetical protein
MNLMTWFASYDGTQIGYGVLGKWAAAGVRARRTLA